MRGAPAERSTTNRRARAKVNPLGEWLESSSANNYFWYDVWLNPRRARFEIRGSGRTACGSYAP